MRMQVEIFQETNHKDLEKAINNWLGNSTNIHIEHITQSQVQHGQSGPMPITVCIWYVLKQ
jgi:hypothetical protein